MKVWTESQCVAAGCDFESDDESVMQEHLRAHYKKEKRMANVKNVGAKRNFLRAQDIIKAKKRGFSGVILKVEMHVPDVNATGIITFDSDVVEGSNRMPVNDAIVASIAKVAGDETDNWGGYGVVFGVKDYSDRGFPPGFVVVKVVDPKQVVKNRKTKPTYKVSDSTAAAGPEPVFDGLEDECPF